MHKEKVMTRFNVFLMMTVAIGTLICGCGSDSAQSSLEKGISAFDKKNYSAASECLDLAAKEINDSAPLYYTLGLSHLNLGDMKKALAAFNKTIDIDPAHYESIICLGQIAYHENNDLAISQECFETALKMVTDAHKKAVLYTSMAIVESGLKNDGLARLYLIQALSCDRSYAPAFYNLGSLYKDKFGYKEEALKCFKQYAQLADKDENHYVKAEKNMERLNLNIERLASSRQATVKRDTVTASENLGNGVVYQSQKKYLDAIKFYDAALAADPLAFSAAYGKAMAYQKLNRSREAFAAFKAAIEINHDHQDSYIRAVKLAMQLKRFSDATTLLDRAIARNPSYSSYYDFMTRILYEQSRYAEAKKYGEYYLSLLEPGDKDRAAYEKWVKSLSES
jgi:tetratricopeptide (TPR) repeat protein